MKCVCKLHTLNKKCSLEKEDVIILATQHTGFPKIPMWSRTQLWSSDKRSVLWSRHEVISLLRLGFSWKPSCFSLAPDVCRGGLSAGSECSSSPWIPLCPWQEDTLGIRVLLHFPERNQPAQPGNTRQTSNDFKLCLRQFSLETGPLATGNKGEKVLKALCRQLNNLFFPFFPLLSFQVSASLL